ncbi:MAG: putative endonuclease [Verrucomicrobiales bacterium]|jgi:putative endonuclease
MSRPLSDPLPEPSTSGKMDQEDANSGSRWVLYVLRCQDDSLYCGITTDLARRVDQHNEGKGARYTKGRGPLVLLKSWPAASQSAALRAEYAFKALSREAKERKLRSRSRSDTVSRLLRGE